MSGTIDLKQLMLSSRSRKTEDSPKENIQTTLKTQKKSKGGFKHGASVIMKEGEYKGYHGFVADFYPATYVLSEQGNGYTEVQGQRLAIGERTITSYGDSMIKEFIPAKFSSLADNELLELIVYNNESEFKLGYVWKNKAYMINYFLNQGLNQENVMDMISNPNNIFIVDINNDFTLTMDSLHINRISDITDDIIESMNNMHFKSGTIAPISLVDNFSNTIKYNETLQHELMFPLGKEYLDINNVMKRLNPTNVIIKRINKRDVVGKPYFMYIRTGDYYIYRPDQDQYYVSYNKLVQFKPNMIEIQKNDKRFAKVKTGPYARQIFKIEKYNPAHLKIILSSNGRTIESHLVRIIDRRNNSINKTSQIYPKHVFYIDLLLKNGNLAECVKIIDIDSFGRHLEINEQINQVYVKNTISEFQLNKNTLIPNFKQLNGFHFVDYTEQEQQEQEQEQVLNFIPKSYEMLEINEEINQENGDQPDFENEEKDYGEGEQEFDEHDAADTGEIIYENNEVKVQSSFKDNERMYRTEDKLTSTQKSLKSKINSVSRLIGHVVTDEYELLKKVENVLECVKNSTKTSIKLDTSTNIKYVITCIIIYDIIQSGINFDLDIFLKKLFPEYFTIDDISNIENNVFINTKEQASESKVFISNILQLKKSKNYREIIKVLLLQADKIIQQCLGIHVNMLNKYEFDAGLLIPLGVSTSGKRLREEENELALKKLRTALTKYLSYKDILNNKPLPEIETPIQWAHYKSIIDAYKRSLEKKQPENNYKYIIENIYRIPFALQDDIPNNIKKYLTTIFNSIKLDIQRQISNENSERKRHQEQQRKIIEYRKTSNFKSHGKFVNRQTKFGTVETFNPHFTEIEVEPEIKDTGSYLRKKKLMQMKNSIGKSSQKIYRDTNISKLLKKKFDKMTVDERITEKKRLEALLEKDTKINSDKKLEKENALKHWKKLLGENDGENDDDEA